MNMLDYFHKATWRWASSALIFLSTLGSAWAADEFLAATAAFELSAQIVDSSTLRLHWQIAKGYHLYRDRIHLRLDGRDITHEAVTLPAGKKVYDANFSKDMEVYEGAADVLVALPVGQGNGVELTWQGCADAGLCYPPETASLNWTASTNKAGGSVQITDSSGTVKTPDITAVAASTSSLVTSAPTADLGSSEIERTLASGNWLHIAGLFGLAGLLLAFTPCVLPMVPILSSLIAGQGTAISRRKGFGLSAAYSVGMALVYAAFGVMAGLAGEGLAAALQNPWVLGSFALLLAGMSLSMFGMYELQMPSFIQSRATEWSNRFQGGSFLGVFLMGGISALVVGPCVAAPLAGALVFISQTRDVVLGGMALFSMAMGMSVPLLLVGLSAGSLLPRAGAWMERVKQVFGMMLLGVAIWIVSPVLLAPLHMAFWAIWFLVAGALLGIFEARTALHSRSSVAARAGGAAAIAVASILLLGAASGGQSVVQPLAHLRGLGTPQNGVAAAPRDNKSLRFEKVVSLDQLEVEMQNARQRGQTVMLDFYADWCVACKEFESMTFSDPSVQTKLKNVRLLQADVTANNTEDRALMKRFGLFGPPSVLFFDHRGGSDPVKRVIGYQNASEFLASLEHLSSAK